MFNFKKLIIVIIFFFTGTSLVFGYVAESPNYRLEKDSINFAGDDFATSSNYILSDTLGEVVSGDLVGVLYSMRAGYRATGDDYTISISAPENISLSELAQTASSSEGSGNWVITTDNPGGYLLYASADSSPSLKSSTDNFSDYTSNLINVPDFYWSIASDVSEFGFTVFGSDINSVFKDNGSVCNVGSNITIDRCWFGLSTSDYLIASSNSANSPTGAITTIKFKAEIGGLKTQTVGSYTANITLTALTQ
ncbi:MAG: hypothetical protein WCX70_00270 [Candidatus Paceibacterota bacterium]|jgi:hypothetical protein